MACYGDSFTFFFFTYCDNYSDGQLLNNLYAIYGRHTFPQQNAQKNGVFWVVTPCGAYKNGRFGGTWRLIHQGDKNEGGARFPRNFGSYKSHTA
jgi:hypothetical protein